MLARAAEVGHEAASAAAGAVKHAAAVATGTAAEQKDPAQQLEDVYRSIQDMERERAGDASFQAASKKLGN
jgi:putative aminopeptidase FrvX